MGHVERETAKGIRIWAPAQVAMPNPASVFFMPIAFCEQYFDMFWTGARGTNEIPEIIKQGYAGYFKNFTEGGYLMAPVAVNVGIEGHAHVVDGRGTPEASDKPVALEVCPACHSEVSNWTAHYPVMTDPNVWLCEIAVPDIRERFPDYEPSLG